MNGLRKIGRIGAVAALGTSLVLVLATSAFALTKSVSDPMTNMTITVTITNPSGNNLNCTGRNDTTNNDDVDTIGVSEVCQYKDGSGNWHDFETAPGDTQPNSNTSGTHTYSDNPCVGSDGGANLPSGNWDVRGQAGGWTINNGNRLTFKGGGAAQVGNLTVSCNN
jgi:hypothetical protein